MPNEDTRELEFLDKTGQIRGRAWFRGRSGRKRQVDTLSSCGIMVKTNFFWNSLYAAPNFHSVVR